MDTTSYEHGRLGIPPGPNTDMDSYMDGKRAAEERNRVPIDGAAFTLLLTSPLLFTVFPAWGLGLYAAGGGVWWLLSLTGANGGLVVLAGLAAAFAAFFFGIGLERVASQFAVYRMVRAVSRWVTPFLFVIWMGTSNGSFESMGQLVDRASPGTFFTGILAAIAAHFIFRKADRLYFPVAKEVAKMRELAARGESLKRGFGKRVAYSLLWIVPVVAISNLIIRVAVGSIMEDPDRVAFYAHYGTYVSVATAVFWFVLCIAGILPGTGRVAMSNEKLQSATS